MKLRIAFLTLISLIVVVCAVPSLSQTSGLGTVKGVCKDAQGNPVVGAGVIWHNNETGREYKLKTNKKGEYFSLGIEPSHDYTVSLVVDGKVVDHQDKFRLEATGGETTLDFDEKASQEQAIQDTAKQKGMTAEQVKEIQEQQKKTENYNANIKAVNEKLNAAAAAKKAGNYDQAIALNTEATQMVPNEDLVWFNLGSTYLDSAKAQTDPQEKLKRNTEAYNDIQKAVELKKKSDAEPTGGPGQPPAKKPEDIEKDKQRLAAYYDNLAAAAARSGKPEEAATAYKQAAELDPAHAGNYYFNLGAVLTNTAKDQNGKKEAADAFDKAIAADPTKADAYYWKGSNLIALATSDSSGKLVAPPGTAEAFQKYLDLQPTGPHAEEAKAMLAALNTTVESSYGKKAPPKKKP